MNELYWISRLDMINGWLIVSSIVSGVLFATAIIPYYIYKIDDDDCIMRIWANIIKKSAIVFFICLPLSILTPTKNEAFMIWGVGGTIDYIKSNGKIQQLPNKCIDALDAWVESLSEGKKNNEQ